MNLFSEIDGVIGANRPTVCGVDQTLTPPPLRRGQLVQGGG